MKKTFVLGVLVPFALCITSCTSGSGKMARATDEAGTELAALINSYQKDGQYTKKTNIHLNSEAVEETQSYFHAGATELHRTTYYDETVNALYMCDINGVTAAKNNGGYIKVGNDMVRYHLPTTGDEKSFDFNNIFNTDSYEADYTVKDTDPNHYFYVLSSLANSVNGQNDWIENDGIYTHTIVDGGDQVNPETGDYVDPYLKGFQYFAAPMILQSFGAYLTFDRIEVTSTDGTLAIALYLDSTETGKLDNDTGLFAEARIYKGLQLPGFYLVGNFSDEADRWQIEGGIKGEGEGGNLAVFKDVNFKAGDELKICALSTEDGKPYWNNNLGNSYAYVYVNEGGNLQFSASGKYNVYLNSEGYIYIDLTKDGWKAVINDEDVAVAEGSGNEIKIENRYLFANDTITFTNGTKTYNYKSLKDGIVVALSEGTDGEIVVPANGYYSFYVDLANDGKAVWVDCNAEVTYYLVGRINKAEDWARTDYVLVPNPSNPGEFMLPEAIAFKAWASDYNGDSFKVKDSNNLWYPDTSYNGWVPTDGNYQIYFNPNGNSLWGEAKYFIVVAA